MKPPATPTRSYFRDTRSLLYSYLVSLPLLLLYEVLIYISQPDPEQAVRISVDVWIKTLFSLAGTNVISVTLVVAALLGLGILYREREKLRRLRLAYFAGMLLESTLYALLLAGALSALVGALGMFQAEGGGGLTTVQQLALSLGAGLYEELFFRVLLVGGVYFILRKFFEREWLAFSLAVLAAALLFSGAHYIGEMGDAFTLSSFLFRFLFGLALNAVYLWRGFGMAAWTHAIYDLMVVTIA